MTVGSQAGDLGACCACGKEGETVRNVMMLEKKAPVPGTGWGCVLCHLPNDGAVAIVCDDCVEHSRETLYAINGFAKNKLRILITALTGKHEHNMEVPHI